MMDYQHAINILHSARVYRPAVAQVGRRFYVFSRTEIIGSGDSIESAMRDSGRYPAPARPAVTLFTAVGSDVLQGEVSVCVARSPNTAQRIANALNEYKPSPRGF